MHPSLLFDARLVLAKPTGIGQYITSLLPQMIRLAPDWHFHVLHQPSTWPDYGLTTWKAPNLTLHSSHVPHMAVQQQVYLPRLARQLGVALMHYPHFDAPVLWRTVPVVVTIHDAKYLVHPGFFPQLGWLKRMYMRLCFVQSLRRAAATIVDSHHTAQDLVRLCGALPGELQVIYGAANDQFRPAPPGAVANLRQRYALSRPFILSVGECRPHKNYGGLIQAYAVSHSRHTHDVVIIGQAYQEYSEPQQIAQQLGLQERVHFLHNVSDADLVVFYSAAAVFALVSFYEGLGLPILEAMACGTPVIVSATTAAGEVAGTAGLTVNPHDPAAIATALDAVLQQPARRQALIQQGEQRWCQFTWERAAEQTLSVYQQVVA